MTRSRIYQRRSKGVIGLPGGYRAVLEALDRPGTLTEIEGRFPQYAGCPLREWVARLERLGLIESVGVEWLEALLALGGYEPLPLNLREEPSAPPLPGARRPRSRHRADA